MPLSSRGHHRRCLREIIQTYDSILVRAYCRVRFLVININILDILALCIRGKRRILDIGCGFGLFGCYLARIYPEIHYSGYDLNALRIEAARAAARRLGLSNVEFHCSNAMELRPQGEFDAILMVDLLHHLCDADKQQLINRCSSLLSPGGHLVIKDVTTRPFYKIVFTWVLDVAMTHSFDMWYRDESQFAELLSPSVGRVETFPISDWLPYPHIVYLCEKSVPGAP